MTDQKPWRQSFPTRAKAEAKRASLQAKLDVAKALVLRRTPPKG
jgi:hypothetical protein